MVSESIGIEGGIEVSHVTVTYPNGIGGCGMRVLPCRAGRCVLWWGSMGRGNLRCLMR